MCRTKMATLFCKHGLIESYIAYPFLPFNAPILPAPYDWNTPILFPGTACLKNSADFFPVLGPTFDALQALLLTHFASHRCASRNRLRGCEEGCPVGEAGLRSPAEPTPPNKASQNAIGRPEFKQTVAKNRKRQIRDCLTV